MTDLRKKILKELYSTYLHAKCPCSKCIDCKVGLTTEEIAIKLNATIEDVEKVLRSEILSNSFAWVFARPYWVISEKGILEAEVEDFHDV
ncbi:hypothetical protein DRH29_03535 [candidate division Kazan bacterium]|uniref:Uncharacterized protein n=1 Tax=candidate division Kazan bacterium TaxID=2202143 RepID=A0A420ZC24_UNCK3|nr:MAG: hypothetical protein DRH29_03535 [candidate division Kazan bacterium]